MDIDAEDLGKDHIFRSVSRESCSELLMSLKFEEKAKLLFLGAVGKDAVVADLLESPRQHMHEEAANELLVRKGHLLAGITVTVVLVPERDRVICHVRDAAIGNGDSMSVASKIIDGIAASVHGFLDVGAPVSRVELIHERLPAIGRGKLRTRAGDRKLSGGAVALEGSHELSAEQLHRGLDRDEEGPAALHELEIASEPCT